jgi:DNA polymerase-3 subunit delta
MPTFFDELERIKKGNVKSVYLLDGNDLFLEEQAIKSLLESFDKIGYNAERKRFYSGENADESFITNLTNIGLFSIRQCIVYKNVRDLLPSFKKQLLNYVKKPDQNTLLILTNDGKKSGIVSDLRKFAYVILTWTPSYNQFPLIVKNYLSSNGYEISPDALDLLISSTNDSLSHTFSELEKVFILIGENKKISVNEVRTVVSGDKDYAMSDFTHAVCYCNKYKAIDICMKLTNKGVSAPFFISTLYRIFLNIWAYEKVHKNVNSKRSWEERLSKEYKAGYDNYKNLDFGSVFYKLSKADLMSKSTGLKTEEIVLPLLLEILSG